MGVNLPGRYCANSGSKCRHQLQDGSAHIPDVLASLLYKKRKWRRLVHLLYSWVPISSHTSGFDCYALCTSVLEM